MKIEILFPEWCNLFGDMSNMRYLRQCLPNAEFIETAFEDEPKFVKEDVNLIYMGPMTEKTQEKVIDKLMPLKAKINELIEGGTVFLFTGNAFEVLGNYIENTDGSHIPTLGIFNFYAKRNMMKRHNSLIRGEFEDTAILGFKTQFTMSYPSDENNGFVRVIKGIGLNKKAKFEGIHYKNFFGTYIIGPILVMNPSFTKKILKIMGSESTKLAFEEEVNEAYKKKLADFLAKG